MADPFWKTSDKIQRVLWKVDEDTLDKVWEAADHKLRPDAEGVWDGRDISEEGLAMFKLGQMAGTEDSFTTARDVWGWDTGGYYVALFVGAEEDVMRRLQKCGVPT